MSVYLRYLVPGTTGVLKSGQHHQHVFFLVSRLHARAFKHIAKSGQLTRAAYTMRTGTPIYSLQNHTMFWRV